MGAATASRRRDQGSRARPSPDDTRPRRLGIGLVIARRQHDLAFLDENVRWEPLAALPSARPWSDDFSNIVSAIDW